MPKPSAVVTPPAPRARVRPKERSISFTHLELRSEDALPEGVCGRIQGVALTYDTVDYYGTMFAPGCMARSIVERVAANKVNLFLDHTKEVRSHVGIVRTMNDIGDTCVMTADILDTVEGRDTLEYCKAIIAAGGETGISIGFIPRKGEVVKNSLGTATGTYRFTEIELREESITPVPAVDGAQVTGARTEDDDDPEVMVTALRAIVAALPLERLDATLLELGFQRNAAATPTPEEVAAPAAAAEPAAVEEPVTEDEGLRKAPMADRIKAIRESMVAA